MAPAVNDLNEEKLAGYLEQHMPGFKGPLTASKFSDGQSNPTFKIEAESGAYVLRRKPPGTLLKSAHAVDREFRVISALQGSDVPVATPYHLCQDDNVIGSWFYVMSFEDGRIFWDPVLPELPKAERKAYYDEMNRVMAAIHDVDLEAVGLSDYGAPGNYFERQTGRWSKQYVASRTSQIEAMEYLMTWLPENMPEDDGSVSLIHGDYRLDNLIFHKEKPEIIAVVDWELSTLGHPLADLSYQCMQWRLPRESPGIKGLGETDRPAGGLPTEADYVRQYCDRRGIGKIEGWPFYLAFNFFRLAAIVQGVYKRALDGNASSEKAHMMGAIVPVIAGYAIDVINRGEEIQ
ncbi:phosphotransferase [Emcibacter sp.]|uniref:phosphotransferase n=1 Tax=Emcibacter sp. TaxID=1979954 RepID=UPI002AA92E22|nr:phosphotransferase [Emcibacter sp.]